MTAKEILREAREPGGPMVFEVDDTFNVLAALQLEWDGEVDCCPLTGDKIDVWGWSAKTAPYGQDWRIELRPITDGVLTVEE